MACYGPQIILTLASQADDEVEEGPEGQLEG